ncbi:putative ATP-grasp-modified RiPP [Streptomyces albofaciens JCM 4342]|uniref:putative ATP-grasp-modified RiPP n=1 Tax=Streptomyces albofaciens TaxID=66866 RepID=UPI000ACE67F3|nr:putative ATP-grasp-modified RiPP [Streptomyces albofaciens]KAA6220664.1 putative ATP-grasp-modified RiPP [Streptomyces albofaciens JCM 4342]
MTTFAHPREGFPLAPDGGPVPYGGEKPGGQATRPWILRFARVPDAAKAATRPDAAYDAVSQVSVGLLGEPLPFANTHNPTVPDGSLTNPPPLDEGPKD